MWRTAHVADQGWSGAVREKIEKETNKNDLFVFFK